MIIERQVFEEIMGSIADGSLENDLKHGSETTLVGNDYLPICRSVVFIVTDPIRGRWFGWLI